MNRRAFLAAGATTFLGERLACPEIRSEDAHTLSASRSKTTPSRGTAEAYEPTGRVPIEGAKEVVVSEDGTTAFLAVTDGFATVDMSDPASPTVANETRDVLADHEAGPLRRIWDVAYGDDVLVVASQGGANGPLYAFVVYDVSDPADPRKRLSREVRGPIHNCDVADGHVYLTGLHGGHHSETGTAAALPVEIYDVGGEGAPKVAEWSLLDENEGWADVPGRNRVIHDVSIVSGRAYLAYWDAGAVLLDVSDPAAPEFLSRVGEFTPEDLAAMSPAELDAEATEGPAGNAHYVTGTADGALFGVGTEAWDDPATEGGGPGGIDLYDASDPTDPQTVATVEPEPAPDETDGGIWTTAHNFEIHGDRLYSAWYRAGVKIHDISDPGSPQLLAWWLRPRATSFWTAQVGVAREFFVATTAGGGDGRLSNPEEALFTFPDRAGEQENPPSLSTRVSPTPSVTPTATLTKESPTEAPGFHDGPGRNLTAPPELATATPLPPNTSATGRTASGTDDPSQTGGQPGFGALAAVGGLAIGAYRYLSGE